MDKWEAPRVTILCVCCLQILLKVNWCHRNLPFQKELRLSWILFFSLFFSVSSFFNFFFSFTVILISKRLHRGRAPPLLFMTHFRYATKEMHTIFHVSLWVCVCGCIRVRAHACVCAHICVYIRVCDWERACALVDYFTFKILMHNKLLLFPTSEARCNPLRSGVIESKPKTTMRGT